jgi:hypothetical protein
MADPFGIVCVVLTYLIVLTVQLAFMRIGIWDHPEPLVHIVPFQLTVVLILSSHYKCMTTDPGFFTARRLNFKKMP